MPAVRAWCFALLWILTAVVRGQDAEFVPPPAPADQISDEARLFAREPESRLRIAERLAALGEKHGYRFYLALYDSLYGRSLSERAQLLQQAWLGAEPGIVLVLETDSRAFKVGQTVATPTRIGGRIELPVAGPKELAPTDLSALVRSLDAALRESKGTEDYVVRLATGMADGISGVLDERSAAPEGNTRSRMILLAIGLLAGAGLVALLVVAGLKRAEARSLERYVFPRVKVGTRLGAPFGGGKISSRSFGNRGEGR
jgi:hypothetical protein